MSKIHTGGAAFPHKAKHWDSDSGCYVASLDHHEPGMTLRDYFAAAALTGWLATDTTPTPKSTAKACYNYADAMLAARKEGA
jgi:hypothetical protein